MPVQFDGVADALDIGTLLSAAQNRAAMSFACWVFPITIAGGNRNIVGYSTNNGGVRTTNTRMAFQVDPTGPATLKISGRAPDTDPQVGTAGTAAALASGAWSHVAGTVDVTGDSENYYVNGAAAGLGAAAAFTNAATDNTTSACGAIAAEEDPASGFNNARIGLLEVWSRMISLAEVQTIHACKGAVTAWNGLLSRWLMAEGNGALGAGAVVKDSCDGARNNGTTVGAPSWVDAGPFRLRRRLE